MTNESWRMPDVDADEEILFEEPGRIIGRVTFESFAYRVTKRHSVYYLLCRNGAGDFRQNIEPELVASMHSMDSGARFMVCYSIYRSNRDGEKTATAATSTEYRKAFVEGRLKKRKVRGQDAAYRVWIEPGSGRG